MGAPKEKIIVGLATYGRTFTLSGPDKNGMNVPTRGGGKAGLYTREEGFLSYYEVSYMLMLWNSLNKISFFLNKKTKVFWNKKSTHFFKQSPFLYSLLSFNSFGTDDTEFIICMIFLVQSILTIQPWCQPTNTF